MKIILSRKGFDSGTGGGPSPIINGKHLLSLPIPVDKNKTGFPENNEFKDLYFEWEKGKKKSYQEIIKELKINQRPSVQTCHLDPDLRRDIKKRRSWRAAFGQSGSALGHLEKMGVKEGDLFLFFGWFRNTEVQSGKLRFAGPDLHVLYGYLQVGEILKTREEIKACTEIADHPHAQEKGEGAIYLAAKNLDIARLKLKKRLPGFGCFSFNEKLVLTEDGLPRSRWRLPREVFFNREITYHPDKKKSWHPQGYFQSCFRGQEFVVVDTESKVLDWASGIIAAGKSMR